MELLFRAFSDGTRVRILSLLRAGELCVCDLVSVLGVSQPKVSRHLAYLRRAGLVVGRREGLWMHYRLAAPRGKVHRGMVAILDDCVAETAELRKDAAKLRRSGRGTGCC